VEEHLPLVNYISHETRTPLTIASTSCELLLHYSDRMSEEQKRKRIHHIDSSSKTVRQVIDKTIRQTMDRRAAVEGHLRLVNEISSETRTPLTVIAIECEMLLRYSHRMSEEQQRKRIQYIVSSIKTTRHVIRSMEQAEYWLIGRRSLHSDTISLRKYISDYLKDFGEQLIVAFETDVDEITLDSELLHLVLRELTTNAAKFSPPESKVDLTFRREEEILVITVKDRGIGIPEQDRARVFQPHFRGSNNYYNAGRGGLGWGLHVVYESVKRWGGSIDWRSEPDTGTMFEVRLPLDKPESR